MVKDQLSIAFLPNIREKR